MAHTLPVSDGLICGEHKRRMGAAIWEYFYLLARVTSDEPDGNGMFYGVVNFGNPISAETVARDLQEAPYTAKDHLRRLEIEGYVRREFVAGAGYSYTITKSKRWLWKRENAARRAEKPSLETVDDRGEIPTVPARNPHGGENPTVENTNGDRGQKPTTSGGNPNGDRGEIPTVNKERKNFLDSNKNLRIAPRGAPTLFALDRPTKTKGSRIPEDFQFSERHRVLASELGVDVEAECEKFRDHFRAKAGRDAMKLDWDAAFRNWLRNAKDFKKSSESHGGGNGKLTRERIEYELRLARQDDANRANN